MGGYILERTPAGTHLLVSKSPSGTGLITRLYCAAYVLSGPLSIPPSPLIFPAPSKPSLCPMAVVRADHISDRWGRLPAILTLYSSCLCSRSPSHRHALALRVISVFAVSLDSDLPLSGHSALRLHTPSLGYFPPLDLPHQPDFQLPASSSSPPSLLRQGSVP